MSAADPLGPERTPPDSARTLAESAIKFKSADSAEVRRRVRQFWRTPSGSERVRGGLVDIPAKKVRQSARAVRRRTIGPPRTFDGGLRCQADFQADFCPPRRTLGGLPGRLRCMADFQADCQADFCPPPRTLGGLPGGLRLAADCPRIFHYFGGISLTGKSITFVIHTSLLIM